MKDAAEFAAMYRAWWHVVRAGWSGVPLLLAVLFSLWSEAEPLTAQTLRGLVVERVTDRPIDLVGVAWVEVGGDTVATATSDARGFFSVTG